MASSGNVALASTPPHSRGIIIRSPLSRIELLDTELLSEIFLMGLNFDFPKAVPLIGYLLSCRGFLRSIVIEVFGPYWDIFWACPDVVDPFNGPSYHGEETWNHEDQSALLRCRWASLDLILSAKDIWIQKDAAMGNIRRYCSPFLGFEEVMTFYFDLAIGGLITDCRKHPLTQQSTEENVREEFKRLSDMVDNKTELTVNGWGGYGEMDPRTLVPDRVIRGPWTRETTLLLFWLLTGGASSPLKYGANHYYSDECKLWRNEVAKPGLKDAIAAGNIVVLYLFNKLDKKAKLLDGDMMLWTFYNAGDDKLAVLATLMSWRRSFRPVLPHQLGNPTPSAWAKPFLRRLQAFQVEKEIEGDWETLSYVKATFSLPGWNSNNYW